jgi:hypothetical protein
VPRHLISEREGYMTACIPWSRTMGAYWVASKRENVDCPECRATKEFRQRPKGKKR